MKGNNSKKTKNKFLNRILKHRLSSTIALILVAIIMIIIPQCILNLPWINEDEASGIFLISNSAQIVSALFVIIGTVIAVWQYYLSSSNQIEKYNFSRVEKAIELSNYYKDNILYRYSYVKKVFDECKITQIIESKRKKHELKDFDIIELKEIYTKEEIQQFEQLRTSEEFIRAIVKVNEVCSMGLSGCVKSVTQDPKSSQKVIKIEANREEMVNDFFKTYISQTLNNLEYFAMSFTHNTADESVIFQSIYPTYIEICFVMYYYIAKNSDPSIAKLYTNLAGLYRIWRERELKQKEEIKKQTRDASRHIGTVMKFEK